MNASDIINRFPSVPKLAAQIGESRETIYMWRTRNSIPPERAGQLLRAAKALGASLTKADLEAHWLEVARNKAGAA